MRIGIFDSGVGGLNVLNEMIKKYPNNDYIYYGDTLNVPYGNKTKGEILILSEKIVHFFEKKKVDIIIVACGTISSNCYRELKIITNIPIYDIISPTIRFLKNSTFKRIGIIATARTIESKVFDNILNKKIITSATPKLVPIIENNTYDKNMDIIISEVITLNGKIDCLVLGCTHYPLIKDYLSEYFMVPLIDMGVCLANSILIESGKKQKIKLYFSLLNKDILANINKIIPYDKKIKEKSIN